MRPRGGEESRLALGFGPRRLGRGGWLCSPRKRKQGQREGSRELFGTTGRKPVPVPEDTPSSEKTTASAPCRPRSNIPISFQCSFQAVLCFLTHLFATNGLCFFCTPNSHPYPPGLGPGVKAMTRCGLITEQSSVSRPPLQVPPVSPPPQL